MTQPIELSHDPVTDIVTIDGYRFTRELFTHFTASPCGVRFRIVARDDGVITISQERDSLEAAAPDMLTELREDADFLTMQFAQAVDPDNPRGWSEPDAYERYSRIKAVIAKAEGRT